MKRNYTLLLFLLATVSILAQTPEKMSYQAVLRDASSTLLTNQQVGIQISILETTITGTAVYTETQTATTNINGLVSLEIGTGSTLDDFTAIDWSTGPYFIKTATDASGGSNYSIIGTSQLMSVPYALQSKTATTLPSGIDQGYIEALEARIAALEPQPAAIGDIREGGVVFWVDPADNTHGLVCAFSDYATTIKWGCWDTDLVNVPNVPHNGGPATGLGAEIGDGINNTNNILKDCPSAPAALAARSLGAEWFLPSAKELNQMNINKLTLEAVVGFSAFSNSNSNSISYWSSTESGQYLGQYLAWGQSFFTDSQVDDIKSLTANVRAVRAF
jgi:hypothetical protein